MRYSCCVDPLPDLQLLPKPSLCWSRLAHCQFEREVLPPGQASRAGMEGRLLSPCGHIRFYMPGAHRCFCSSHQHFPAGPWCLLQKRRHWPCFWQTVGFLRSQISCQFLHLSRTWPGALHLWDPSVWGILISSLKGTFRDPHLPVSD